MNLVSKTLNVIKHSKDSKLSLFVIKNHNLITKLSEPPMTSKIIPPGKEVGVASLLKQIHVLILRKTQV